MVQLFVLFSLFRYICDLSTATINLLTFIMIAFIRYMSIVKPQGEWVSKKFQILILCLVWIVPFVIWSIVISILFHLDSSQAVDCNLNTDPNLLVIADVFAFLLPFIILLVVNVKLIWELIKRSSKVTGGAHVSATKTTTLGVTSIMVVPINNESICMAGMYKKLILKLL